MNDNRILQKTVKGLLKKGYPVDNTIMADIRKTIRRDHKFEKKHPYYILWLVRDYGFYIGMTREGEKI